MENQTTQKMTYESRMALVAKNFSAKMSTLYQPHVRMRDNEAGGIYLKEIAEAINSRLPSEIPNNDVYIEALREVWKISIEKHKSSYWFDLATVIAATNKVASKYYRIYGKKKETSFQGQADNEPPRKKGEGWSLEGARKALADTDQQIASGELGRGMGEILRKIPLKAIERLTGEVQDIAPPPVQATPKEHLPDAPPECNENSTTSETVSNVTQVSQEPAIAKPLMAQSESELNMRLLKAGMTKPEPIDKPDFDAVIEAGGDDLPDWGKPSAPSFDAL